MARKLIVIALIVVAVGALFFYLTVSSVRLECEVTVVYKGRSMAARTSGSSKEDAVRTAVQSACSQVSHGMTELIECENTPPKSISCK